MISVETLVLAAILGGSVLAPPLYLARVYYRKARQR